MRKSTTIYQSTSDIFTGGKRSDRKVSDTKKWKDFQQLVNELQQETYQRLGFYIEFLGYVHTAFRKDSLENQKVHFKHEKESQEGFDVVEKLRVLKELQTKLHEKVSVLESRLHASLNLDNNSNEAFYENLKTKYEFCKDLKDATERDLLQEIENKIDPDKCEEAINAFI